MAPPFHRGSYLLAADEEENRLRLIDISLPINQRQHRTLHTQKDVLPYASC